MEHGEIGWVLVAVGRGKGLHGGRNGVVLQDRGNGVQEDRLAISTVAVDKQQRMLVRDAGQAIAEPLLQETDEILIVARRIPEKLKPARASVSRRRYQGNSRDAVFPLALPNFAGSQVDRA